MSNLWPLVGWGVAIRAGRRLEREALALDLHPGDRTDELVKKVNETLIPSLSKMPGFNGYFLIEADNGVMSSVGFFDTSAQADESTRVAANWVRDEKLESVLPNQPKIMGGEVLMHKTLNGLVRA